MYICITLNQILMRKLFFIVLIGFLGVGISSAQEVDLGIKLGANFSNFSDVKDLSMSSKTGFHFGAFAAVRLGGVSIQPEVLYSQQGAKFDAGKIELDYVNVPVILKYYLFQGVNLQVGPQFGFLVNDNVDGNAKDLDTSGVVGIGLDLPLGIRFDGRYNFGFGKALENNLSGGKTSMFTLALGYSFL